MFKRNASGAQYRPSTSGAGSTVLADDTANGNAGPQIQASQCEQDLADQWMQVPKQLVHNDDCLTNVGGNVKLEKCAASGPRFPRRGTSMALRGRGNPVTVRPRSSDRGRTCFGHRSNSATSKHLMKCGKRFARTGPGLYKRAFCHIFPQPDGSTERFSGIRFDAY